VIVAVEGPSAAGKTTWCTHLRHPVVAEYAPTGQEPADSDPARQGMYWTEVNVDRWRQALEHERRERIVLCDSDPMKLHYSWSLARIGAAPWSRFEHELNRVRVAIDQGLLGFADLVVVSIPSLEVLRRRRAADTTRRRRSFELHARLSEPLREWYRAVEQATPGRVIWTFPEDGVPTVAPREDRGDPSLLRSVLDNLPAPTPVRFE
jgi:hypothetical protein